MILPIPKSYTKTDIRCEKPLTVTYSFDSTSADAKLGANAFKTFCADAKYSEEAFIHFRADLTLDDKDEIYRVSVKSGRIEASFRDARGAVNAAATVALMLRESELNECEIIDWPDCGFRAMLLDIARGFPTEDMLFSAIRYIALAKFNKLHLHIMDSRGLCYVSEAVPEYKYEGRREPTTKEFMKKIARICDEYAIEVIPEIEIPSHVTSLFTSHPEFLCQVEDPCKWTLCPGNDDIWPFYDALVGEVIEIFPNCKYINMCGDEIESLLPHSYEPCHWDECPRCAALREREGLADKREEFYYVVEKMNTLVKSHGKKLMISNDQVDVSKPVPLSRDILVFFWRTAADGRGPNENCNFEKFLDHGFEVINSFFWYTYFDEDKFLSPAKLKNWTPYTIPTNPKKYDELKVRYDEKIIGACSCSWEFGNYENYPFYAYVTPAVFAIFGDTVWRHVPKEYTDEYKAALSAFMFGTEEFTDVFDYVGDLIPPSSKEIFTYANVDTLSKESILACAKRLDENATEPAANAYSALLRKIAELTK